MAAHDDFHRITLDDYPPLVQKFYKSTARRVRRFRNGYVRSYSDTWQWMKTSGLLHDYLNDLDHAFRDTSTVGLTGDYRKDVKSRGLWSVLEVWYNNWKRAGCETQLEPDPQDRDRWAQIEDTGPRPRVVTRKQKRQKVEAPDRRVIWLCSVNDEPMPSSDELYLRHSSVAIDQVLARRLWWLQKSGILD